MNSRDHRRQVNIKAPPETPKTAPSDPEGGATSQFGTDHYRPPEGQEKQMGTNSIVKEEWEDWKEDSGGLDQEPHEPKAEYEQPPETHKLGVKNHLPMHGHQGEDTG